MSREQQINQQRQADRQLTYNNFALKPDYYGSAVPKRELEPVKRPVVKPRKKPRVNAFRAVVYMIVVGLMFGFIISRYSVIASKKIQIQETTAEITKLEDASSHLMLELSGAPDAKLQETAQTEYKMGFPTDSQVASVEIPVIPAAPAVPAIKTNWFDKVLDFFS